MSKLLLIESTGEAPIQSFTTLGFSTARGDDEQIGMFGSGAKHAIIVALRTGTKVWIYSGKTRVEFGTRRVEIAGNQTTLVTYQIGDGKPKDTGWTLGFGEVDWDSIEMALREWISNALDQGVRTGTQSAIELVDSSKRRARVGFTRIYVQGTSEVLAYYDNRTQYFLQLREAYNPETSVLRNTEGRPARVYRAGVYIAALAGVNSLFDYCLKPSEIKIDECRNSNSGTLRLAIGKIIRNLKGRDLEHVLRSIVGGTQCLEASLSEYEIFGFSSQPTVVKEAWQEAWKTLYGPAFAYSSDLADREAAKRGLQGVKVPKALEAILGKAGVTVADQILGEAHSRGVAEVAPREALLDMVGAVQEQFQAYGIKIKSPRFFEFTPQEGSVEDLMKLSDAVGINSKLFDDGREEDLRITVYRAVAGSERKLAQLVVAMSVGVTA